MQLRGTGPERPVNAVEGNRCCTESGVDQGLDTDDCCIDEDSIPIGEIETGRGRTLQDGSGVVAARFGLEWLSVANKLLVSKRLPSMDEARVTSMSGLIELTSI